MADRLETTAAELDLVVEQGATFNIDLTWLDENEDLIDLDGYKAVLQVRSYEAAKTVLLEMSSDNGRIVLGSSGTGDAGKIKLRLTRDETAELSFTEGKYQLELEQGDYTQRLLKGKFIVDSEIVR